MTDLEHVAAVTYAALIEVGRQDLDDLTDADRQLMERAEAIALAS